MYYYISIYLYRYYIEFINQFFLPDISIIFLVAHLAKGKVSYCGRLSSIVCCPLTFHILIFSSETPFIFGGNIIFFINIKYCLKKNKKNNWSEKNVSIFPLCLKSLI